MPTSQAPTGRGRRVRISMTCHTGIEPLGRFLDFYSRIRKAHRQEYLRICLIMGFRSGSPERSGWPEPSASGKIRKLRLEFLAEHPRLGASLNKYDAEEAWDKNTRWVLKTILAGHEILSGAPVSKNQQTANGSGEIPPEPEPVQNPFERLFS